MAFFEYKLTGLTVDENERSCSVSIRSRLKALEDRIPAKQPEPTGRSEARERLREHLDLIAKARRGNLSEEEVAEVESVTAAIQRRLEEIRGGGGR